MSDTYEDVWHRVDCGLREYMPDCKWCSQLINCPGYYSCHPEGFTDNMQVPIVASVPDAIVYDHSRTENISTQCPERLPLPNGLHTLRDIAVCTDGGIDVFSALNPAFTAHAMHNIKFVLSQLYFDIPAHVNNILSGPDLSKVIPHEKCAGCERFGVCSGLFVPVADDATGADGGILRDLFSSSNGRLLYVGSEGPVLSSLLADKSRKGEIVCVEPDSKTIEDFSPEPEYFDCVLMLFSYNRLPGPVAAMTTIIGAMKSGARLLIVDSGLFIMLRANTNAAPAEALCGPVNERYRHHFTDDAARLLAGLHEFKLGRHGEVSPSSPNQWFLELIK